MSHNLPDKTFMTCASHPETPIILECMANRRQNPQSGRVTMNPPASKGTERSLAVVMEERTEERALAKIV